MTATAIDTMLVAARRRLVRLSPREAFEASQSGAVLVDTRPHINRRIEGAIPGALVIERNELEWRLDPTSDARLPVAAFDRTVVLFCNEGYASSLAAASLQDLGVSGATDIIGGYRAWCSDGLPVLSPPPLQRPNAA